MWNTKRNAMILESTINRVIEQQHQRILKLDGGLIRELVPSTKSLSSHALIISGIRRCGKSTLLLQLMNKLGVENTLFLNFESPQLYEFSLTDFARLDSIIQKRDVKTLLFDELQLVDGWEMYVREKLDEGYQVVITGSNASLLSKELGTRLTGRHITQELFPFSYNEFIKFKGLDASQESLTHYMFLGGFPEYLKSGDSEQLSTLFNDILIRDIVARYGIKDIKSLQRLASYLFSNIGNRITATKLKQPLSIGATSTILSWISHLELSYLLFFVPMYSHSLKAQLINPRKVYSIDLGLADAISTSMTQDLGRKLENMVFLHLRRKYTDIYYFDDKGECDFVVLKNGEAVEIIQVCYDLNSDNLKRELDGLMKALQFFNKKSGTLITFDTRDTILEGEFVINVLPAYKYLC